MHVIIVSGVVVRLSHVEPEVSGWNPASYPFFFPSVFLSFFFFSFLFCSVCLFVLMFLFKYIPSRAKIVYYKQSEFLSFPVIYIPFLLQYILQT